jgi:hypothetical protein
MSTKKNFARLAAAAILTTSVFAGMSGPANAADDDSSSDTARSSLNVPRGESDGPRGGASTNRFDTGWG